MFLIDFSLSKKQETAASKDRCVVEEQKWPALLFICTDQRPGQTANLRILVIEQQSDSV